MNNRICQSCGMPMGENDDLYGSNSDGSKNKDFCLYCYKNGSFTADISMEEMIDYCVEHVVSAHDYMSKKEAKSLMQKMFPMLKRWQSNEIQKVFCKKAYYITIDGEGDPSTNKEYSDSLNILYKVFFVLQEMYKAKNQIFFVSPPHTLWWTANGDNPANLKRIHWQWRAMLEIPEYVTEEDIAKAKMIIYQKDGEKLVNAVQEQQMNEGTAFQVLHTGPYDGEYAKGHELRTFIQNAGYEIRGKHHDIYLDDPKITNPAELRTIIRYSVFKEMEEKLDFFTETTQLFNDLGESKIMVLATTDGNKVSARNMSVIINEGKFYFQTALEFRKCKDIKQNKNVALCVNNIQVEGKITGIYSLHDKNVQSFRKLYKKYHSNSYEAYSKLMGDRVFEVTPEKVQVYCYQNTDVFIKNINFILQNAGRYWYLAK